jgi:tetratricopeptide (TPR) repeat protein
MGWILESEEKYTPALDAYEKVFLTETDDKTKSNAFARLQSIYALPEYASRGRAFLSQLRDIGYISPSEEFVQSANLQWAEAEVLLRRAQDARDAGTLAEAAAAYAQVMQKVPDDGLLCPQARFSLRSICRDPKNAQLCSPYESVLAAIKCGVIPDLPPLSGAK